jgi:hypothetical protein
MSWLDELMTNGAVRIGGGYRAWLFPHEDGKHFTVFVRSASRGKVCESYASGRDEVAALVRESIEEDEGDLEALHGYALDALAKVKETTT